MIFFEDQLGSEMLRVAALPRGTHIFPLMTVPSAYAEQYSLENQCPAPPLASPVLSLPLRPPQQTMNILPIANATAAPPIMSQDPVVNQVPTTHYPEVTFTTPLGIDTPELILQSTVVPDIVELGEDDIESHLSLMMSAMQSLNTVHFATNLKLRTKVQSPQTYQQAIAAPNSNLWLDAMLDQLKKLPDAHTWELV